jgi:hypothetical protein
MDQAQLLEFVWRILQEPVAGGPVNETWRETLARVRSGALAQIDLQTYDYFLEILPPLYVGPSFYAFAQAAEPIKLFFHRGSRCG